MFLLNVFMKTTKNVIESWNGHCCWKWSNLVHNDVWKMHLRELQTASITDAEPAVQLRKHQALLTWFTRFHLIRGKSKRGCSRCRYGEWKYNHQTSQWHSDVVPVIARSEHCGVNAQYNAATSPTTPNTAPIYCLTCVLRSKLTCIPRLVLSTNDWTKPPCSLIVQFTKWSCFCMQTNGK